MFALPAFLLLTPELYGVDKFWFFVSKEATHILFTYI